MATRFFVWLILAFCFILCVGGCTSSKTPPSEPTRMQVSEMKLPATEILSPTLQASIPACATSGSNALPECVPGAESPPTSFAVTPTAVDQVATATLTVAAPAVISPSLTPEMVITDASPQFTRTSGARLQYVFPIRPPKAASYGAVHHDYPATDIFAPRHSVFVAVTDGTIQELSNTDEWDPQTDDPALRGGKYVSLIGDDGVRYYGSHLDEVADGLSAGMHVTSGTVLGYVGNTGNARGIAPHLHFGISPPTFVGDWKVRRGTVLPYSYLQAWARGEDLTPAMR